MDEQTEMCPSSEDAVTKEENSSVNTPDANHNFEQQSSSCQSQSTTPLPLDTSQPQDSSPSLSSSSQTIDDVSKPHIVSTNCDDSNQSVQSNNHQTSTVSSSNSNNNNNNINTKTKIFVGRLPEGCSSKDLEDLFGKYGTVSECDVVGKFGFVHMSKTEEAEECVKKLNKYSFMGSSLTVEFSTSKVHPEPGTLGRAKNVIRTTRDHRARNGPYPREHYRGGHSSHGYKGGYYYDECRYDRDPYLERDSYYHDRDRRGPYLPAYDRRPLEFDNYPLRDYRPSMGPRLGHPVSPPDNIYARRGPRVYDRTSDISTPLYSTRSPDMNPPHFPGPQMPLPPPNRWAPSPLSRRK
ncbi:uncharacterized protein LOC141854705 [Brevipalpus obovatus]|uniref:uncharacterized protein LOC141854705 n=1 Tax=Brevipalpus obovatus TaxID=246614 RepID=UPI003D9DBB46